MAAVVSIVRWYTTPTGLLFAALGLSGVVTAWIVRDLWPVVAAAGVALMVFFPLKSGAQVREIRMARQRLDQALESARARLAQDLARTRSFAHEERRNYLATVESLRAEYASLLKAERLLREAASEDHAKRLDSEVEGMQSRFKKAIDDISGTVAEAAQRAMKPERAKLIERVDGRIRKERSSRLLESALRRSSGEHPAALVILITPQRTGSTWLLDMLRAHPDIGLWPTAEIFERIGGRGRRYPADLSMDTQDGEIIEVQAGVGGIIPWSGPSGTTFRDQFETLPPIAVEKIHPMTVDYDIRTLGERLDEIAATGIAVRPVYLTRDPVESIRSFLAYQARAEKWHANMPPDSVVSLYHLSLRMMEELSAGRDGPFVSYERLRDSAVETVTDLYRLLTEDDSDAERVALHAVQITRRDLRASTQSGPFVDSGRDEVPDRSELLLGWPRYDEGAKTLIRETIDLHHKLSGRATGATPG
jgi:hypothetical protein